MTAHYFASKKIKFVVISETLSPVGKKFSVSGKAEARRIASEHGAEPYNF